MRLGITRARFLETKNVGIVIWNCIEALFWMHWMQKANDFCAKNDLNIIDQKQEKIWRRGKKRTEEKQKANKT